MKRILVLTLLTLSLTGCAFTRASLRHWESPEHQAQLRRTALLTWYAQHPQAIAALGAGYAQPYTVTAWTPGLGYRSYRVTPMSGGYVSVYDWTTGSTSSIYVTPY